MPLCMYVPMIIDFIITVDVKQILLLQHIFFMSDLKKLVFTILVLTFLVVNRRRRHHHHCRIYELIIAHLQK